MSPLSFRQRFPLFLAVALPALGALGTGRLLANSGSIFAQYLAQASPGPLPTLTRFALGVSEGPARSGGSIAAIVVACVGFLIVHRSPPEFRAPRLLLFVTLVWLFQVALLMLALIGFALPFARA